jgi:hypothetical protein
MVDDEQRQREPNTTTPKPKNPREPDLRAARKAFADAIRAMIRPREPETS